LPQKQAQRQGLYGDLATSSSHTKCCPKQALVEFLVARGANPQQLDFWQYTPEEKAHSEAVYAFYEIAGLRRESTER